MLHPLPDEFCIKLHILPRYVCNMLPLLDVHLPDTRTSPRCVTSLGHL